MSWVYKFLDKNDTIIYIGKTHDMKERMMTHFGPNGHLPKECYMRVERIFCTEVRTKTDTDMLETLLINTYHPEYNTDKKFNENLKNNTMIFTVEVLQWREAYVFPVENGILFSWNPIKRRCYSNSLSLPERVVSIIYDNIYMYHFKKLAFWFLKEDEYAYLELLEYAKNHMNYYLSDVDEPVTEYIDDETIPTYAAADVTGFKEDIKGLCKKRLCFWLEPGKTIAIPLLSRMFIELLELKNAEEEGEEKCEENICVS